MNGVIELLLAIIPAALAITLHETAHGYAALAMGDDTAAREGRLSINPLRHIDRVGTIVLPGILIFLQLLTTGRVIFLFGWAKPVPVAAWKFRNPRQGMMVVAAAGPAANFVLAYLGAFALRLVFDWPRGIASLFATLFFNFILANLALGLFNLLPIPPLDGGRIMVGLLPRNLAWQWAKLERIGILLVVVFVLVLPPLLREFGLAFDPVGTALNVVLSQALQIVMRLAGAPISV